MTARELFETIGLVDEDLIAEADAPVRRPWTPRLVLRRALPLAACLCVAAGAVIAWRIAPWQGMTGSSIQSEAAAAPDLAAAEDAPETYQAPADGGTNEETAGAAAPENSAAANKTIGLPAELEERLAAAGGGMGVGVLLAADADELALTDLLDGKTPETLPVYRGTLADLKADPARMEKTLRAILTALGYDPILADTAELCWHAGADAASCDALGAKIVEKSGVRSALDFWGGVCTLEAALPDGGTLTVSNDGTVRWQPDLETQNAESGKLAAADIDRVLAANADLLQVLGGYTVPVLGVASGRSYQDGSLPQSVVSLAPAGETAGEVLFGRDLADLRGFQTDADGKLTGLLRFGSALAEPIGEYEVISREEAEQLLMQGGYLDAAYYGEAPEDGTVAAAQLCYLRGRAQYYVPMWRFVVDMGVAEAPEEVSEEAAGLGLHAYREYYVPAVDLDALADLIAADQAREETSLVWDAITPSEANGGGPSLAISAEELLGDTANPEPTDLPETLPVYRNPLADGGLDESGMRGTLRQVLQAMGRDPDLADDAVLVYNWSQDQIDQADQIAADLQQQFGSASVLEFWGGMAQLELTLDDGSSLTVQNSRKVYLSAAENTSLRAMTSNDLTANASLLQGLGGFDTLRSPVSHSWSDGSALNDGPVLTRSGAPGSMTGLQTGQDSSLAAWTLSAAASATPVAELPIISLAEAENLLQNGGYLGVGYEEKEPAQGTIVDARLGYLSGKALYYVPVWQFTVDMGQPDAQYPAADPDTGETLHAYFTYYVPAIDLDTLADIIAADQAG